MPYDMQEAVALAHLSVATGSGDDDEEVSICPGRRSLTACHGYCRCPSAWWETPAVTTRALSARPEEARTARHFVRELLTCWGLEALADDAEDDRRRARRQRRPARDPGRAGVRQRGAPRCCGCACSGGRGEVMLAVVDPGNETPMPRRPDWGGESGRGLQIVGALSHVWGWSPIAGHGKAVWAVLRDP